MSLRKRRRVEELPFAGLHDIAADPATVSFVVYGFAATLHPLDQANDDEGAELVPWPEGSPDPVLVDRFDCRLLLESSDVIDTSAGRAKQRRGNGDSTSASTPAAKAMEVELDEQRWRDLFHPPPFPHLHHHRYYHHYSSEDDEKERQKRTHGAAIQFSYADTADDKFYKGADIKDQERVYYLEDLEPPPPPPPYLESLHNNTSSTLISLLKESSAGNTQHLPFTARQYAIMERTAEFLRTYGDQGGADMLYTRAFSDPTFAFLSPGHLWNDFFQGLLVGNFEGNNTIQEGEKIGKEKVKEEQKNVLTALLEGYTSDDAEEEDEEAMNEAEEKGEHKSCQSEQQVVETIIALLITATTSASSSTTIINTKKSIAQAVKALLSIDPVIASIITPKAPFYFLFKDAVEGAIAAGKMDPATAAVWLEHEKSKKSSSDNGFDIDMEAIKAAGKKEKIEEPASAPAPVAPALAAAVEEKGVEKEKLMGKKARFPNMDDAVKKEQRKKKVRLLLEKQRQAEEERRQGQTVAKQHAEEERNQHLAAISVHKKMFLNSSDDDE